MQYMNNVLMSIQTPDDAGVAIEYQVPLTSKRVDFILSGANATDLDSVVIVELKQWSEVSATSKDAIVKTWLGKAEREVTHPSYQAWSYASLIYDFNTEVQKGDIALHPCAYLHNCKNSSSVKSKFYAEYIEKAPVFVHSDTKQLGNFIRRHIHHGDRTRVLNRIEHGKLRPSKNLVDHLASLLSGNPDFIMIDDQKVVFETALELAKLAQNGHKQVLLVEGGPGTGKSVVAINLLVELTKRELVTQYVSRNAAPRAVYEKLLTRDFRKTHITNLFKGSGSYVGAPADSIDCLIVDEAHRLNEKSGFYGNEGENQIKEIVQAAKFSIFFLDQDQRVTFKDIGDRESIENWGMQLGANIINLKLESQFRCNGSDGYLSWVNHVLQIQRTANQDLRGIDYDFQVFNSPNELKASIQQRNRDRNKSRMVAGYCWDWKGKRNPEIEDVVIPEHNFAMRWNLDKDGSLWIIAPESVNEIGCIHTCQGLELDYVGVIIGLDFIVRDGSVITNGHSRSSQDRSIRGFKNLYKSDESAAKRKADQIIKNTYRTLMTRGQKGCYLFCVDKETNDYFKQQIGVKYSNTSSHTLLQMVAESKPG